MKIFVTGIGTDVGKTIPHQLLQNHCRLLETHPKGDLDNSDSHKKILIVYQPIKPYSPK
jgi:hypothetical protein